MKIIFIYFPFFKIVGYFSYSRDLAVDVRRLQESGPKENSVKMAVASAAAVMVAGSVSQAMFCLHQRVNGLDLWDTTRTVQLNAAENDNRNVFMKRKATLCANMCF